MVSAKEFVSYPPKFSRSTFYLHNPALERMEEHFIPHYSCHGFTTHLIHAEMRREFIQELRGDSRREAIDIYDHIDLKELKEAYLACIPQLGI